LSPSAGGGQGQRGSAERTALIFFGIGLGDVAAAALIYERATEKGIGQVLEL
jgi:ornithine cyclodeaminase/alanine dehydrogenase-like protein (mu-crystallin family)